MRIRDSEESIIEQPLTAVNLPPRNRGTEERVSKAEEKRREAERKRAEKRELEAAKKKEMEERRRLEVRKPEAAYTFTIKPGLPTFQ